MLWTQACDLVFADSSQQLSLTFNYSKSSKLKRAESKLQSESAGLGPSLLEFIHSKKITKDMYAQIL